LSSTPNPSMFTQSVTFTATVTGNGGLTGTVTFKDGETAIGTGTVSSGHATLTTTMLAVGSHTITAIFSGDASSDTSTSGVLTQTVNKAGTTTSLSSSVNPSMFAQSVTFTATV